MIVVIALPCCLAEVEEREEGNTRGPQIRNSLLFNAGERDADAGSRGATVPGKRKYREGEKMTPRLLIRYVWMKQSSVPQRT